MPAVRLIRDALKSYFSDRGAVYAAGIAYYAVFAIAPLIVFVISVASIFIERSAAASQVMEQLEFLVGPELAALLGTLAGAVSERTISAGGTLLSAAGLVLGAVGIFNQLYIAINDIWGISTAAPTNITEGLILVRHRATPFVIVFFLGLALSSSVLVDTVLGTVSSRLAEILPRLAALLPELSRLLIPALAFATFAAIFKWLPNARSRWRDVAVGALVTTLLFLIGRVVLNFFLGRNATVSLYGAAGSVIILLIWVNASAQILLFGAEFTKLYADRFGQPITPQKLATISDPFADKAAAREEVS